MLTDADVECRSGRNMDNGAADSCSDRSECLLEHVPKLCKDVVADDIAPSTQKNIEDSSSVAQRPEVPKAKLQDC